jgi:hypothetical protein
VLVARRQTAGRGWSASLLMEVSATRRV